MKEVTVVLRFVAGFLLLWLGLTPAVALAAPPVDLAFPGVEDGFNAIIALSSSPERVVTAGQYHVRVWDRASWQVVRDWTIPGRTFSAVGVGPAPQDVWAFSPEDPPGLFRWSVATGQLIKAVDLAPDTKFVQAVQGEHRLLARSGDWRQTRLETLDLATGLPDDATNLAGQITHVAVHGPLTQLALQVGRTQVAVRTGLRGPDRFVTMQTQILAFAWQDADHLLLLTAPGVLTCWQMDAGKEVWRMDLGRAEGRLLAPDQEKMTVVSPERWLATTLGSHILFVDLSQRKILKRVSSDVSACLGRDYNLLCATARGPIVVDHRTGGIQAPAAHRWSDMPDVTSLAWQPDGSLWSTHGSVLMRWLPTPEIHGSVYDSVHSPRMGSTLVATGEPGPQHLVHLPDFARVERRGGRLELLKGLPEALAAEVQEGVVLPGGGVAKGRDGWHAVRASPARWGPRIWAGLDFADVLPWNTGTVLTAPLGVDQALLRWDLPPFQRARRTCNVPWSRSVTCVRGRCSRLLGVAPDGDVLLANDQDVTVVSGNGRCTSRTLRLPGATAATFLPRDGSWAVGTRFGRLTRLDPDGQLQESVAVSAEPLHALTAHPTEPWLAAAAGAQVALVHTTPPQLVGHMLPVRVAADDGSGLNVGWLAWTDTGLLDGTPEALDQVSAATGGQPLASEAWSAQVRSGLVATWQERLPAPTATSGPAIELPDSATTLVMGEGMTWVTVAVRGRNLRRVEVHVAGTLRWSEWVSQPSGETHTLQRLIPLDLPAGATSLTVVALDSTSRRSLQTSPLRVVPKRPDPGLLLQVGHAQYPMTGAVSPDARWLATMSEGREVRVWEVATGTLVRVLHGVLGGWPTAVRFSDDGRSLTAWASTERDWKRTKMAGDETVFSARWRWPEGTLEQACIGQCVGIPERPWPPWDEVRISGPGWRVDGKVVRDDQGEVLTQLDGKTIAPTGTRPPILITLGEQATIWDTSRWRSRAFPLVENQGRPLDGQFSADGRELVMRIGDQLVRVALDGVGGEVLAKSESTDPWSPSGRADRYAALRVQPHGEVLATRRGRFELRGPGKSKSWSVPSHICPLELVPAGTGQWLTSLYDVRNARSQPANINSSGKISLLGKPIAGLAFPVRTAAALVVAEAALDRSDLFWLSLGNHWGTRAEATELRPVVNVAAPDGRFFRKVWWPVHRPTTLAGHAQQTAAFVGQADGQLLAIHPPTSQVLWRATPFRAPVRTLSVSADGQWLLAGATDGSVAWLDTRTGRLLGQVATGSSPALAVHLAPDRQRMVVTTYDGLLHVIEVKAGRLLAHLAAFQGAAVFAWTDSGSYMASKGVAHLVTFREGNEILPLDAFDIERNRPHEVLGQIGLTSTDVLATYRQAWIQRGGGRASSKGRPTLSAMWTSDGLQAKAQVRAQAAPGRRATHLQVRVQDIPVASVAMASGQTEVAVDLVPGSNRIHLTAVDDLGRASLPVVRVVQGVDRPIHPTVHVLAVGVSDYDDGNAVLEFADDDARALVASLSAAGPEPVRTTTLVDATARHADIVRALEELRQTQPDDRIVVFLAGHGLVHKGQFYFAPKDMDFRQPKARGVSLQRIEQLLSQAPARQRVILIDSCQSGSLLGETAGKLKNSEIVLKPAQRGAAPLDPEAGPTTQEVMQALFADLSRGSGALVLAAAAGQQVALEREGHGLFTSAVLSALGTGSADADQDGTVTVQELQVSVARQVRELSGGAQLPAFRRDPLGIDLPFRRRSGLLHTVHLPTDRLEEVSGGLAVASPGQSFGKVVDWATGMVSVHRGAITAEDLLGLTRDGRHVLHIAKRSYTDTHVAVHELALNDPIGRTTTPLWRAPDGNITYSPTQTSRDGKILVVCASSQLAMTCQRVSLGASNDITVTDLGPSPSANRIVLDDTGERMWQWGHSGLLVRDTQSGAVIWQLRGKDWWFDVAQAVGQTACIQFLADRPLSVALLDRDGKLGIRFDVPRKTFAISVDPHGKIVVSTEQGGMISVWSAENGKLLNRWNSDRHEPDVLAMRNGLIATASGARLQFWDPKLVSTWGPGTAR